MIGGDTVRIKKAARMTIETNRVMVMSASRAFVTRCTDCNQELMMVITEPKHQLAWCMACAAHLRMVRTDEATKSLRITSHAIRQWVNGGVTQFIKTADGMMLIILISPAEVGKFRQGGRSLQASALLPASERITLSKRPPLNSLAPQTTSVAVQITCARRKNLNEPAELTTLA